MLPRLAWDGSSSLSALPTHLQEGVGAGGGVLWKIKETLQQ